MSEDWVAVAAGAALVALVLAGVRPGIPALGWGSGADLAARVVAIALGLGLVVGHTTPFRAWFAEAVQAELYIKIGLVVMGAGILFSELVQIGVIGIVQAIIVVLSVWFFSFWLAKRLNVDDELAAMMVSAVSICGVSAAIAACGAIQGDRRKLSYVTSLVLIVAVPMLIVKPWIAKASAMTPLVAGAWLGGTLDTSAAVVAAGEIVSPQARNAVVVKLSQKVLIGVAAFLLTVWWTLRSKADRKSMNVGLGLIWERFPKFVLGFLLASLVFSFLIPSGQRSAAAGSNL